MTDDFINALGLASPWTYLALFLGASLLLIWRLEALLARGLEGTALGTIVMPYCSGLGNLLLVAIVAAKGAPQREIVVNCIVNNVTNLTLVLAIPALIWGLSLAGARPGRAGKSRKPSGADTAQRLNQLSLLLTLAAVGFFAVVAWALSRDGSLDRVDGFILIALFAFWQCLQVFDVLKHNVRENRRFGIFFAFDILVVVACGYFLYVSIDWLVTWLTARPRGFFSVSHLGWLSGWLMVLPNAILACYYARRGRADIVYSSQIGDGHICIPLCLGLAALQSPIALPPFFNSGLAILVACAVVHALSITLAKGLPKWLAWTLVGAYATYLTVAFAS